MVEVEERNSDLDNQDYGSKQKYKCHICDNIYKHSDSLEDHVAIAHDQSESLLCNICNLTFNHIKRLLHHTRVVHEEKYDKKSQKSSCPDCGKIRILLAKINSKGIDKLEKLNREISHDIKNEKVATIVENIQITEI